MRKIAQEKVELIEEQKRDYQVYVGANHCSIKGFGWFIPQYLPVERKVEDSGEAFENWLFSPCSIR